jgi:DNA replication and repair protein RecF
LFLVSITLRDFRNYTEEEISFSKGKNLILGDNGAGKSNLLEAIYMLSTSKSFRQASDGNLTRWGCEGYHIGGIFTSERGQYAIDIFHQGEKKRLLINGTPEDRISNLIGYVYCIIFHFDDILLVTGPPRVKRGFLDLILSTVDPLYFDHLRRYLTVVKQKSRYLKDTERVDLHLLQSWNEQLAQLGGYIVSKRYELVRFINMFLQRSVREVYRGEPLCSLIYRTAVQYGEGERSVSDLSESFGRELERRREREIRYAQCLVGPHRDDLSFMDENHDIRHFGSIGEARLSSIFLKLAQASFYSETKGVTPLLLMDDILLELDRRNMEVVVELLDKSSQIFITTAERSKLPEILSYDTVFHIREGKIG